MKDYFFELADALEQSIRGDEVLLLAFDGEDSDFVRMNRAKVRQAGSVARRTLELDLVAGRRHAAGRLELAGDHGHDLALARDLLEELRAQRAHLPPDPYLHYAEPGPSSEREVAADLGERGAVLEAIEGLSEGLDLVGIWAAGPLYSGFASSLGQRCWHQRASFNLDWSCYHAGDKAVKANYAGLRWEPAVLEAKMAAVRAELAVMARSPKTIEPGRYRAFLAPRALGEVTSMLAWGGFGLKSARTGQSPLIRLQQGEARLDPAVHMVEHHAGGLEPGFTPEGFAKPERVTLIEDGAYRDHLAGPRSAREYGVAVNAAFEGPASLDMAGGELAMADAVRALDTGLYINDLWYLNYSDRNWARITGMTRYACFWVEDGRIQAPVNVMRFDDTVYNLLGNGLLGLTRERELLLDTGTYGGRSSHSCELPGALIEGMTFTL